MKEENKKHYIYVNGEPIPVSKKVFDEYHHYTRKEEYFSRDLKTETFFCDQEAQIAKFIPSREDSFERLSETSQQFAVDELSVESQAITSVWMEQILEALNEEERGIIHQLYYLQKPEREACAALNLSRTTFQYRKDILLKKLREMIEKGG